MLVVSINLSKYILDQVHDALGHNGTTRHYQCPKWLYLWKGLRKDVNIHVKQGIKCRQQNLHPQHCAQLHLELPSMSMHFTVIDLIGKFKPSPQGHQYALTAIDMLINYTW